MRLKVAFKFGLVALCLHLLFFPLVKGALSASLDDLLLMANKSRREGKLDEALNLYSRVLPQGRELSPYIKFYIGLINLNKKDYAKALEIFNELWTNRDKLPKELEAILPFRMAQAHEGLGERERAYDLYLITLTLGTDYLKRLAYYRLASIAYDKGNYRKAFEWLLPILENSPNDRDANNLVLKLFPKVKEPSAELLYRVGRAYYLMGNYSRALDYFRRAKAGFWEGLSLERLGRREEAFAVYSSLIRRGDGSEALVRRFVGVAERLGLKKEAYDVLRGLLRREAKDKALVLYYLYYLSEREEYKRTLKERYPTSKWALNLSWFEGWKSYSSGKYRDALKEWDLIIKHHKTNPAYARVLYYLSKVGLYPKDKAKNELLSFFPLEYYTLKSYGLSINDKVPELPKDELLRRLFSVGFWEMALIRAGLFDNLEDASRQYYLSLTFEKLSEYRPSIGYAYLLINSGWRNPEIWRRAFPLGDHYDYIVEMAKREKVDPLLVLAVIHQESRFDPDIVSWAGAIGLMQLMPFTGESYGIRDRNLLFSPEINIRLGIKHLKEFLDRYNGNLYLALAAYNAGSGNVDRWIKNIKARNWEEWSEGIPFEETRNYVKKVLGAYRAYKELYR